MTYITDEEIADLPEDPEQAFIKLESLARDRLSKNTEKSQLVDAPYRKYLSTVLPAARYYKISDLSGWPRPSDGDDIRKFAFAFMREVDFYVTEVRLRAVARAKKYSVLLGETAKAKLRALLHQMRESVDTMDISAAKKERLFERINALQEEVDRDRTRYEAYADLAIEIADDTGEVAKRLNPLAGLLERIAAAFGSAKRSEATQNNRLPPPKEPRQIEAPKKDKKQLPAQQETENDAEQVLDEQLP